MRTRYAATACATSCATSEKSSTGRARAIKATEARRVFFMENLYLSEVFQAAKSANVSKRLDAGFFSGKRNFRIRHMSREPQMIPAGQEARMP